MTRPEKERYFILSELESSPREDLIIFRHPEVPEGTPKGTFYNRAGWVSFTQDEKIVLRDLSHNLLYVPVRFSLPWRGSNVTWSYSHFTRESALEYARTFIRGYSSYTMIGPTGKTFAKGEIDESSLVALITDVKGSSVKYMLLYPVGL